MDTETILQSIRKSIEDCIAKLNDVESIKEVVWGLEKDVGTLKELQSNIHNKVNRHIDGSVKNIDMIKEHEVMLQDMKKVGIFDVIRDCKNCSIRWMPKVFGVFLLGTVCTFIWQFAVANTTIFQNKEVSSNNACKIQSIEITVGRMEEQMKAIPDQVAMKVVKALRINNENS